MSNKFDIYVIREILKNVDPCTLIRCREVCTSWNREILRMTKLTRKFKYGTITFELTNDEFELKAGRKSYCLQDWNEITLLRMLQNIEPSKTLNLFVHYQTSKNVFDKFFDGLVKEWCSSVQELEATIAIEQIVDPIKPLRLFPNLTRLSYSFMNTDTVDCTQIFDRIRNLRYCRLTRFEEFNVEDKDRLVFNEKTLQSIAANQEIDTRRLQRLEIYMASVYFKPEDFVEFIARVSKPHPHPSLKDNESIYEQTDDIETVHILFDMCCFKLTKTENIINAVVEKADDIMFYGPDCSLRFRQVHCRFGDTKFFLMFGQEL
ncbi:unnamed protein product [Caenorhabditis bovis]|uniref:F-box domain-containing protein n=1 Tax=Caenorhabditis bovis TaxID=2654633 RepID=A0A8S1EUN7_9PELO|nr:unnamed protein product [Caenorhabditis bovis]